MDPQHPQNNKPPFKLTKERMALMLGGTLIGALAIVLGFKLATPMVKKACQSILEAPDSMERDVRLASVEAIVVKPGTISRRITTVGQLHANASVTLRTEMAGRITEIAFKEGAKVKKGDVLIRFDDEELQAQLAKAEADVEYRQVRFGRFESLQAKGLGKGTEYDQERGQLNIAKSEVEVAKAKLAKATIYAPFDGKIGLIEVSVGAYVDSQKELVTLVDFDPMKIDFKIPEKFIHDIGVGQTAEVKLDSFPDVIFQATVEAIDSRVDPQTHSIAVRATIPNEDGKLQPGLFGSVSVIIGVKNDALLVPESALGRESDIEYVWVVVNGKAGRKRVLTSTKENGQAEITAGLRADEIVVTSGQLKLGEGMAVKISNMGDGDVEVTDEDEGEGSGASKVAPAPKADATPKDGPAPNATAPKEGSPPIETPPKEPVSNKEIAAEPTEVVPQSTKPSLEAKNPVTDATTKADESPAKVEKKPDEKAAAESLPNPQEEAVKATTLPPETPAKEDTSVKPVTPQETVAPLTAAEKAPLPEADKGPLPEAVKADSATKEAGPTSPEPLTNSSESKPVNEAEKPATVTLKQSEEPNENPSKADEEKSFFAKSRDFVVNLFKRS